MIAWTQRKTKVKKKYKRQPVIPAIRSTEFPLRSCRDLSFLRLLRIVPSVATKEQVKSKRQKAPIYKSLQMRQGIGRSKSSNVPHPHNWQTHRKEHQKTTEDVNETRKRPKKVSGERECYNGLAENSNKLCQLSKQTKTSQFSMVLVSGEIEDVMQTIKINFIHSKIICIFISQIRMFKHLTDRNGKDTVTNVSFPRRGIVWNTC